MYWVLTGCCGLVGLDTGRATVLTDKAGRANRDQLKKTLNARLSNIVSVL